MDETYSPEIYESPELSELGDAEVLTSGYSDQDPEVEGRKKTVEC
jgi:hypothetical protein